MAVNQNDRCLHRSLLVSMDSNRGNRTNVLTLPGSGMRPAEQNDLDSIAELLDLAFAPSQFESRLVNALVQNTRPIHHWVLEGADGLNAYVCYSHAYRGERPIGFHLAPVAVHPEHQGKGLGSLLIRETLLQPPIAGSSLFVLGRPSYYTRLGLRLVAQPRCPFNPNNDHFMALHYESQEDFWIGYESEFIGK
jgi:putative acetyltransferase